MEAYAECTSLQWANFRHLAAIGLQMPRRVPPTYPGESPSVSARLPFCSSSIEMPSGERTSAMWPSRGARLVTTPPSVVDVIYAIGKMAEIAHARSRDGRI
jgi:hypothetical protein